jgi:hypothetical protein
MRSITRVDHLSAGLAAASALCLVTAAVVPLLPQGRTAVSAGPHELHLAWALTWR